MPSEESRERKRRRLLDSDELRRVLEQAFLLAEEGETVDWADLTDGDEDLAAVARSLVDGGRNATEALFDTVATEAGLETGRERIGDFEIIRALGIGGMARVFEARQISLDRRVALKVLKEELAIDPRARARFKREAEITASLRHPAIVPIHDVGEAEGRTYIAMELLVGENLEVGPRPHSPRDVAQLGKTLAEALHHAHVAGVIHRDVKPGNVMLVEGKPVLLDFGLAWALGRMDLTAEDMTPGTLVYMSPEQLDGRKGLDPRTDIFSLAATLWELIGGAAPFGAESPGEVVRRIMEDEPCPISFNRRDRDLETILLHALDKDRDRRFATAQEFAADLGAYIEGRPINARRTSTLGKIVLAAGRHPRSAAVSAFSAMVAVVLLTLLVVHRTDSARQRGDLLGRADQAITAGRLESARDLVVGLTGRDADARKRRVDLLLAAEELEDEVIDFGNVYEPARMAELAARFDPSAATEPRTRLVALAASILADDRARALGQLECYEREEGRDRGSAAFRLVLDGVDPAAMGERLPAPRQAFDRERRLRERLFCALALELVAAPLELRLNEVESALMEDASCFTARHLAGRVAFLADKPDAALAYYRGLLRRDRIPAFSHRGRARCLIQLGRLDEARRVLAACDVSRPDARMRRLDLELAIRVGDDAAVREQLARARNEFPEIGEFEILAATREFNAQRFAEARELVDQADSKRLTTDGARSMRFVRASMDFVATGLADTLAALPQDDARRKKVEELETTFTALIDGFAAVDVRRLDAQLFRARCLLLRGEQGESIALLTELGRRHTDEPKVVLLEARALDAICMAACGSDDRLDEERIVALRPAVIASCSRLERLTDMGASGAIELSPRSRDLAQCLSARLCLLIEDWAAFDRAVRRYQDDTGASGPRTFDRHIEAMVRASRKIRDA